MKVSSLFTIALAVASTSTFAQVNATDEHAGLAHGNFEMYDKDRDGMLSRDEYDMAATEVGLYDTYDTDGDGRISAQEIENSDLDTDFREWDANRDEYLDEDEFHERSFLTFDDDEDGHWDGDEWDDAGDEGWLDI